MRKILLLSLLLMAGFFRPISLVAQSPTPRSINIAASQLSYKFELYNSNTGYYRYRVELKLYVPCNNDSLPAKMNLFAYRKGNYTNHVYRANDVPLSNISTATPGSIDPCIDVYPDVCYKVGYYYVFMVVPAFAEGIEVFYLDGPQRAEKIFNISSGQTTGAMVSIPGNAQDTSLPRNSSPAFPLNQTAYLCANSPFSFEATAQDADGDSLSYFFCNGLAPGGGAASFPITSLTYSNGYTGDYPLNKLAVINQTTGMISGRTPVVPGKYLVTVCVNEYRKGKYIGTNRKEYLLVVGDCTIARAELPEKTMVCRNFTARFSNNVKNNFIKTYRWDFGVNGDESDTSNQENPVFVYPDTGLFRARLIINEGLMCDDTAYTDVYVYPNLNVDFRLANECLFPGDRAEFRDLTTTTYGTLVRWDWDLAQPGPFGNELSPEQHPLLIYRTSDTFLIRLAVRTSLGCEDTIRKNIIIYDRAMLRIPNDTTMCLGDSIQLPSSGPGSINWTPAYRINNPSTFNPIVFPDRQTTYRADLTLFPGCVISKTVKVETKSFISVDAGPDSTVCLTDTFRLNTVSDGNRFSWSPATTLDNPTARNPYATPVERTTLYKVVANLGRCIASDSVYITAIPYPTVEVSPDTPLCYGDIIQLRASGGIQYLWSPAKGLSSTNSQYPMATGIENTEYTVAVTDNKGCPKPAFAHVFLTVIPPVKAFAGYDTVIIAGQPLQLRGTGASNFLWSPPTGLNDNAVANPIATIDQNITYHLKTFTDEGCADYDDIQVKVFRTAPDIFVPNAFTPNNDGRNDLMRATPVGIRHFDYFKIYNRWGQLIYTTRIPTSGWNGSSGGKEAGAGTFVWEAKGVDYTGKTIIRKGSFILIR